MKVLAKKKNQDHIPSGFAYKLVCVDDKFSTPIVAFRGENAAYKFIETILKEFEYRQKLMKKHFNKVLIMTEEKNSFSWITHAGYTKNSLKMTMNN